MSITNIKKRVAYFYDDKGEFLGKKSFSKTADTFEYAGGRYNIYHDKASFNLVKRWYWDIQGYHYNINNPEPFRFGKTAKVILSPEMYNIQIKTEIAKKLNDLSKPGLKLDLKTILLILAGVVVAYYLLTGNKIA